MRRIASPRVLGLSAFLILLTVAVGFLLSDAEESIDPTNEPDPVVTIERDGLLYTYHVPTDTEGLFVVREDPRLLRNLARERREETASLRLLLERELGVKNLTELRVRFDSTIRRLESLGYL